MKKIQLSIAAALLVATNTYAMEDLGTIIISSATKSEQSIKDITSNVEVITDYEIEEKHVTTITEALNLVSGISFTQNGGIGKTSSLRVRGFDPKRVLVLVDGVRYNDLTSTSGAQFENIMLSDIKQIEVIKGAQSGIWGADASAGVINIITKTPKDGFSGSILAEYGNFNTKKFQLNLGYKTEKYYVSLSHNSIDTDGFSAYTPKGGNVDDYEDDGYKNDSTKIKLGVNIDNHNDVNFAYHYTKSKSEFDNFGSDSLTHNSSAKTKIAQINYKNKQDKLSTELNLARSDFYREYPTFGSTYDGTIDEAGIKTNLNYLNDTSFIIAGVDYKKFKQEDVVNKNYTNKAVFLTNSNKFTNTVFTQSLRFDNYDSFKNKTTGKLGLKHNFTNEIYGFSNIATAYNIPTLGQMYGAFGANPNLQPETMKSYDVGFGYQDLKVTYFHNLIKEMIEWSGGYNNVSGESKITGLELDYKKNLTDETLLTVSYTRLLKAKNNNGVDLHRRAKQNLKFGIDYYGIQNMHIGVYGEYVGSRFNDAAKTSQTGKYTIANMVINYDYSHNMKIYGKIDNITDKNYQTVDTYATSPRAFYAGIKYSF